MMNPISMEVNGVMTSEVADVAKMTVVIAACEAAPAAYRHLNNDGVGNLVDGEG
jgi:hypothetical protein